MNPLTPKRDFYDTPQGSAQLDAIDARFRARLQAKPDPVTRAAAFFEYRQERYIDTGLMALRGPDAVYHFEDAARYVFWAASALHGRGPDAFTPDRKRPRGALQHLDKGYGYRLVHGWRALHEALALSGASRRAIDLFDTQCAEFSVVFEAQLGAADTVNAHGGSPHAVADAVRMFAGELYRVCEWLDGTRRRFETAGVRRDVDQALEVLNAPTTHDGGTLRRRKKKARWY